VKVFQNVEELCAGWQNFSTATTSAGPCSAWATSRQPKLAANSLHSGPLHEYTELSVPKLGARQSYSSAPFPRFFDDALNGSTMSWAWVLKGST